MKSKTTRLIKGIVRDWHIEVEEPKNDELWLAELIRKIRLVVFDFDGVFTDNTVYVSEDGKEAVRCWRGDGIGLRKLQEAGIQVRVLSGEMNQLVASRCKKLEVRCNAGVLDKHTALHHWIDSHGYQWSEIAYVGNDVNDLICLQHVGLPIVVRDAHPDVVSDAVFQTIARGGRGAVREVCDLFMSVLAGARDGNT